MKKSKKEYSNDELGELIIPRRLTEEDRRIFREAIAEDKKKMKQSKSRRRVTV